MTTSIYSPVSCLNFLQKSPKASDCGHRTTTQQLEQMCVEQVRVLLLLKSKLCLQALSASKLLVQLPAQVASHTNDFPNCLRTTKLFAVCKKWWLERRLRCMFQGITHHSRLAHSYKPERHIYSWRNFIWCIERSCTPCGY